MTIPTYEFTKRLFIWFVVAVSLVPRQHIDRDRFSIGGSLSFPFKRLLLAIACVNFVRLILKDSSIRLQFRVVADTLGVVQQFGYSFLCFLTPYILQKWLSSLINIGGRPGASLLCPLYLSTFLSVASVILVRTSHPNWWCLRKLGNAVSSPPVLKTLTMFNAVTTRGGHHDGRGSILSQSLKVVEYWFMTTQVLCAIGFAFDRRLQDNKEEYNQLDHLMASFREIAFISDWTRILAHALFTNQLDELCLSSSLPSTTSDQNGETTASNDPPTDVEATSQTEIVSLVRNTAK